MRKTARRGRRIERREWGKIMCAFEYNLLDPHNNNKIVANINLYPIINKSVPELYCLSLTRTNPPRRPYLLFISYKIGNSAGINSMKQAPQTQYSGEEQGQIANEFGITSYYGGKSNKLFNQSNNPPLNKERRDRAKHSSVLNHRELRKKNLLPPPAPFHSPHRKEE